MLRLTRPQESLWDHLLPSQARTLSDELTRVDALLADERFLEPYRQCFRTRLGRPTVPVETYLRLMYLKHRYTLGYETLVREVADSLHWRRFCRIPLDGTVPHSTTLIKLTRKYGPAVLHELNTVLIRTARERKLLRGQKLRMDTTVIQAPIEHPTDIGLLADGVRVVTRLVRRLQTAGAATRTRFRNRHRTVTRALRAVGQVLRQRTGDAKVAVDRHTARILAVSRQVMTRAQRVLVNSRQTVRQQRGQGRAMVQQARMQLHTMMQRTSQVMVQTEQRLQGVLAIPDRLVSLFDPEARPIRRGKLSAKTEFGYKALLTESEERLITHYEVHVGNPGDSGLLAAAFERHVEAVGRPPRAVATDRGFASKINEDFLRAREVPRISLPYRGRLRTARRAHERQRWFRRLQRWRAGQEATISLGSRKYHWRSSHLRGRDGADLWLGFGVLVANLNRLVVLGAAKA